MSRSDKPKRYSIAVDFDGVIHAYISPWVSAKVIPDAPVPGALEWLSEMVRHFRVVIHSSRFTPHDNTEAGWAKAYDAVLAVKQWMLEQGLDTRVLGQLEFWMSPGKPTALVYVDDRAVRFQGVFPTWEDIRKNLKPWKVTHDGR